MVRSRRRNRQGFASPNSGRRFQAPATAAPLENVISDLHFETVRCAEKERCSINPGHWGIPLSATKALSTNPHIPYFPRSSSRQLESLSASQ
jgi:hypothetical protein